MKTILKNAQLYILLQAYLQYAPNADIIHGNNGRHVSLGENQKMAWDWMIKKDEINTERRSYTALDGLIAKLDEIELAEWISSDQYKLAQGLFITRTSQFHKVYPINNSGQLYYRLVSLMSEIEMESLIPIMGLDKVQELKEDLDVDPLSANGQLILYSRKIVGFHAMERALILLPDEMLPFDINPKMADQNREILRDKRADKFKGMAVRFQSVLEQLVASQNNEAYEVDQLHGIKQGKNHVNL